MFFRSAVATLVLSVSFPAFAVDNQTTSYGSQVVATRLDLIDQQLVDIRAEQKVVMDRIRLNSRANGQRLQELRTSGAPLTEIAEDPKLTELNLANATLTAKYAALEVRVNDLEVLKEQVASIEERVTVLENSPVTSTTTNNINNIVNNPPPVASGKTEHRSGTQFTLGIGQTLIFSDTLEGEMYGVRTRTDFSGRVGLEVGKFNPAFDANFGLGSGGFSFNGLLTAFEPIDRTNIALGVGPQYACDRFWDDGECNVERVGVLTQFSTATSLRGGAWGLSLRSGVEVSHYLNNDNGTGYTGVQARVTVGAGLYIGRSRSKATFR